jgi:hypothetical protein
VLLAMSWPKLPTSPRATPPQTQDSDKQSFEEKHTNARSSTSHLGIDHGLSHVNQPTRAHLRKTHDIPPPINHPPVAEVVPDQPTIKTRGCSRSTQETCWSIQRNVSRSPKPYNPERISWECVIRGVSLTKHSCTVSSASFSDQSWRALDSTTM